MKIVIVGGTGLIGSKLIAKLASQNHEALAAAPSTGVDTLTGQGLAEALEGASVVVDVSNSPSFEDEKVLEFFTTSTGNLLTFEDCAHVRHHVALSIVGAERMPASGYMRAKLAQEQRIKSGAIPYSIVRATQFFEFGKSIADGATEGDIVHLPPVFIQPMAADDVASAVCRVAVGAPLNGTKEIGGPERLRFADFVERRLRALNDRRKVISDPQARYFGAQLGELTLVPGDGAELATTCFEDWLRTSGARAGGPTPKPAPSPRELEPNEFRLSEVPSGSALLVADAIAVFNVGGKLCAIQSRCTHAGGDLSEGKLVGSTVTCPLHGSQFDVSTGTVLRGPATKPLHPYRVSVDGDIGRIEEVS